MFPNTLTFAAALLLGVGCGEEDGKDGAGAEAGDTAAAEPEESACSPDSDLDNDGLDDCQEEALGTDPESADSDGDGYTDGEEFDCVSDPQDADEQCYACGWEHNDPGNLESTGTSNGDVMGNFALIDQCGEMVDMWDFYGEYHVLYMTAAW
jgi:hypothetical protein